MQVFFREVRLERRYAITYGSAPAVKTLFLSLGALAVFSLSGCAASASSDDDGGPIDDYDAATYDAAKKADSGSNTDTGSQSQCVTSCTQDLDCQNSCPLVPSGINCCDTATGVCYAYSSTTCPVPVTDAGFD